MHLYVCMYANEHSSRLYIYMHLRPTAEQFNAVSNATHADSLECSLLKNSLTAIDQKYALLEPVRK